MSWQGWSWSAYDTLISSKVKIEGGMKTTVKRQTTVFDGTPVCQSNSNQLVDTQQYEIEYKDGMPSALFMCQIADNLWSQVDLEGRELLSFNCIGDHMKMSMQYQLLMVTYFQEWDKEAQADDRCLGVISQWKDETSDWALWKDWKDANSIKLAEYNAANKTAEEPAFKRWVKYCLKKRDRIINMVKSIY